MSIRKNLPEFRRPFHLPFSKIWCSLAFWACSIAIYWCGFNAIIETFIIIIILSMIFLIYSLKNKDKRELELKNAAWFLYYIIGIIVVSYLGDQGSGIKLITGITPIIILFAFSILIVIIAVKSRISPEESALRISLALSKRNKK